MPARLVVSPEELTAIRRSIYEKVVRRYMEWKKVKPEEVTVRDLLPTDLGLSVDVWEKEFTATGKQTIYSVTVPSETVLGFGAFLILDANPIVTTLELKVEDKVIDIIDLEQFYSEEKKIIKLDEDAIEKCIADEGKTLTINGYIKDTGKLHMAVIGAIARPVAKVGFPHRSAVEILGLR